MIKKYFIVLCTVVSLICLAIITYALVKNAFFGGLDVDELFHSQVVYLMNNGIRPYSAFFLISYSPIYHWFMLPIYMLTNFQYETLSAARMVMVGVFLVRMLLIFLVSRRIFNNKIAIVTLFLTIIEPISSYTVVHLRPDNLMIVVFLAALYLFLEAERRSKAWLYSLAGCLLVVASLIMLKVAFNVALFGILIAVWSIMKHKIMNFVHFVAGGVLALAAYLGYFLVTGRLVSMIEQVFLYPSKTFFNTFQYPLPFAFFYKHDNYMLYGAGGKPFNWYLSWLILFFMCAGVYIVFQYLSKQRGWTIKQFFLLFISLSFFIQVFFLMKLQSGFLQYYQLPLFFGTFLAAYAIVSLWDSWVHWGLLNAAGLAVLAIVMTYSIVPLYQLRGTYSNKDFENAIRGIWKIVPVDKAIYPHVIFRPIVYPHPYQITLGDASEFMKSLLPDPMTIFTQHNTQYILNDQYQLSFYPENFRNYIYSNFAPSPEFPMVMVKK